MKPPVENIRVSQRGKDQLAKLVRHTGIKHRNVLCRWALCSSLAEPGVPAPADIPADSNLEISWRVFGGAYADLYAGLIRYRCRIDGIDPTEENLAMQFRLHLHRGIGYLAAGGQIRGIEDLLAFEQAA